MRFLHTADWHIGRTIRGRSREEEHRRALTQVLAHAKDQQVDCLLLAGDLFDTAAPSAESERVLFEFFQELVGLRIPAVVIAGNHDHPKRFDAIAGILRGLGLYIQGQPVPAQEGGIAEVASRDGTERALIAALPWIQERYTVDFVDLGADVAASYGLYAEQARRAMGSLCRSFRPDTVNLLMAHLLVDGALVGPGGGERELHMSWGIYGVKPEMIPPDAQYVALGHVHKPQTVRSSPPACYPGSLLQLDFGERDQQKFVNLIEVHPGLPAEMAQLPITGGRALADVGAPYAGVRLDELEARADSLGDAWLRVFVEVEAPVANLAGAVREALPNAVHIERVQRGSERDPSAPRLAGLAPAELFATFYQSSQGRGAPPTEATVELFRQLLEEETRASAEA